MNSTLWILVVVLGVFLVIKGVLLRLSRRRNASLQEAKRLQFQQTPSARSDQTKRRIEQLQADLANARKKRGDPSKPSGTAGKWSSTMQELDRELDRAADSQQLPANGFADTQPWSEPRQANT